MKTDDLNKLISDRLKELGIDKYELNKMSITDGNLEITPEGELVKERLIEVTVIPIVGKTMLEIPITITINRDKHE